ncbi:MAG: hypothetical protein Q8Q14_00490 [Gemmatimonadales bacterium]|nr:hypothetical protein [Gemmatimonadales bacterium]
MALIDFRVPAAPNEEVTHTGAKLRSLGTLASCYAHLIGWRYRAIATCMWTRPPGVASFFDVQPFATETVRMRFRLRDACERLFVVFDYQAHPMTSGANTVDVILEDPTGAPVHDTVTFTTDDSSLETDRVKMFIAGFRFDEFPFLTAYTPPIIQAPAPRPRLLETGSAAAGTEVVLRFDCANVRVWSATAWEWPVQETAL